MGDSESWELRSMQAAYYLENGSREIGTRRRATPTKLAALCGTYDFVYFLDHENDPHTRNGPHPDYYITLEQSDAFKDADELEPRDIVGAVEYGNLEGRVRRLAKFAPERLADVTGARERRLQGLDADGCFTSNWDFEVDLSEEASEGEEDGHYLVVSTVRDDVGHPFLEVTLNFGYSGCVEQLIGIIAKRRAEGAGEEGQGLSDDEMWRLGCGVKREELMRRMERRKVRMERESTDGGEGVDDEEEYGEGEGDEKESESEAEEGEGAEGDSEQPPPKRQAKDAMAPPSKRRKTSS